MLDINEALNQIIFKYQLDRYYPHYKDMYEAEKILRDIIKKVKQDQKIVLFIGKKSKEMGFLQSLSDGYADIHFHYYDTEETVPRQLENVTWDNYNAVYLVSFYGAEYIERWFRLHDIRYEWLYDIFEREGIFLQREFLSFCKDNLRFLIDRRRNNKGSLQCELYCQSSKYHSANDRRTKRIALERCTFLSLYMKDFITAEEYVSLLIKEDERYRCMWEEIQNLLDTIRKTVSSRKTKDIIVYWLDSIPYGGEDCMPYLQEVMQESVVFENAFTYIPYTKPTLRAMFLGKKDIDDRTFDISDITRDNSPLIAFLEMQGYHIKIYSGCYNMFFQPQYQSSGYIWDDYTPVSIKLWNMISDMLLQEQKTLWVVHALDAHAPCFHNGMSDADYDNGSQRYKEAKKKLDEQLGFYDAFMGGDVYRIYMSDHGREEIYKYHILFNVKHRALEPRRIKGFFSIVDFTTILKQLVLNGCITEEKFIKEHADIGNCDWYSNDYIKDIFQRKGALSLKFFGCKGVVDKDYIYLRYNTGKEWLHKRNEKLLCEPLLFYDCPDDVCDMALLSKYRELMVDYPKDLINDEKFRYTKYLYTLYNNISKHNDMKERVNIINLMLENYPDRSIGIRLGGVVSSILYYVLSEENKKRIWGFIDKDVNCLCSRLGLPTVSPEHTGGMKATGMRAVLLPSFTFRGMLREETKILSADFDILDIYEAFEKNGIRCQEDFYKTCGVDEDYDVGFPFDEVK